MTEAKRIAQEALQRAMMRREKPLSSLSKAEQVRRLEQAMASHNCKAVIYAAQPKPAPVKPRRVPNLKELAFAAVLADGEALMAARA